MHKVVDEKWGLSDHIVKNDEEMTEVGDSPPTIDLEKDHDLIRQKEATNNTYLSTKKCDFDPSLADDNQSQAVAIAL